MLHRFSRGPGVKTGVELGHIELERHREGLQIGVAKGALAFAILMAKQVIMILPKLALLIRALTGLGRPARFLSASVAVDDNEMMVLKPYIAPLHILIDELARRASGKLPAVRSLEVGEFLNNHLGVGRAL